MDQDTLKTIPLFADMPRRRRMQLASLADELEVPAGETLTKEGDYAREFYVIISGSAEVRQNGRRTAELREGDSLGEAGLLGPARTHANTVITTSITRLLVMGPREFASMMLMFPAVADRIRRRAAIGSNTHRSPSR